MKNFIARCLAEGATSISVRDLASMVVPPTPRRFLEPGCLIRFPEDTTVMMQSIYTPDGHEFQLPFVVVKVCFPDGFIQVDKIFLSTLTRSLRLPDGKVIAAHGTAVDYIRSFVNWADALNALRGRTIKVIDDAVYEIPAPGDGFRRTHIYGFDFVGEYELAA